MKNVLFPILLAIFLFSSCNKEQAIQENAKKTAVQFVHDVEQEHWEACTQAIASCDQASEAYKQHMVTLYKQMVWAQKQNGLSLQNVECIHADFNKGNTYVDAYIQLTFSDKSQETILIPLIRTEKDWRIR